jgi:queuosine biosynthesis protein QueC
VTTVNVPENGQVALNPPLTAARSAACSTRSVHPLTLHHLNALIALISAGASGVRVVNPLAHLTKGGVCRLACSAGLSSLDLAATLSCGKPPVRQRHGSRSANCGVCFPCLVRRSGLLQTDGGDLTIYEASPWSDALSPHRSRDWRALQLWLHTRYTLDDLLADTPLPPSTDTAAVLDVIRRGREELAQFLRSSGATPA